MAKDIDECLAVLRTAADRLAPDAEARETFRKQEAALREVASRAEVHSDRADGRAILNGIQAITANAQQLANDLAGFGSTPGAAVPP